MATPRDGVTELLHRWRHRDQGAGDELMALIYRELHKLAKHYMAYDHSGPTLQTTALNHEAYLKLFGNFSEGWGSRAHFLGVAAKAVRHVLVDHARARRSRKRGGDLRTEQLDEVVDKGVVQSAELVALDDALTAMAAQYPRLSRVVELRYFGGFTVEETAGILGVSPETVARDWHFARAFLRSSVTK